MKTKLATRFYLTSNYKVVKSGDDSRIHFRVDLRADRDLNSVDELELDEFSFEYAVCKFNGWDCHYNPDESEDSDYFGCEKWSHRQPYFSFEMFDSDGVRCEYFGDEILEQASIYKLVMSFFDTKGPLLFDN